MKRRSALLVRRMRSFPALKMAAPSPWPPLPTQSVLPLSASRQKSWPFWMTEELQGKSPGLSTKGLGSFCFFCFSDELPVSYRGRMYHGRAKKAAALAQALARCPGRYLTVRMNGSRPNGPILAALGGTPYHFLTNFLTRG